MNNFLKGCMLAMMLVVVWFVSSCSNNSTSHRYGDNLIHYAEHLEIYEQNDNTIRIIIQNPWKKFGVLREYILSNDREKKFRFSSTVNQLNTPFTKALVMTNSHAKLMVDLGLIENIAGVCELNYISDSLINKHYLEGSIMDCGNSINPNIEKIIELAPDVILVSPFKESGYGQLEKLGIPIIECADYMETSPLGRAEWISFYGRLFGCGHLADSLFRRVEERYSKLRDIVSDAELKKPTVMVDTRSGSAWYVAGGRSTTGKLICDAGGDYIFAYKKQSGSVPLSFETVFEKAHNADIWLLKNSKLQTMTYRSLEMDFSYYAQFKPFINKKIWVCDVYKVPYFEITAFNPDILLAEFINIFHPGLIPEPNTLFYHPMK